MISYEKAVQLNASFTNRFLPRRMRLSELLGIAQTPATISRSTKRRVTEDLLEQLDG